MKAFACLTLLAFCYLFHRASLKTKGKGSWRADQWLLRLQGAFILGAVFVWVI